MASVSVLPETYVFLSTAAIKCAPDAKDRAFQTTERANCILTESPYVSHRHFQLDLHENHQN